MILDVKIAGHYKYELFDANGNRLDYVVWADTETGQIERYIMNENKEPQRDNWGELMTEIVSVPSPLRAIKYEE